MSKIIKFLNKLSYIKILKYDKTNSAASAVMFYDVVNHDLAHIKVCFLNRKIYFKLGPQCLEMDEFMTKMSPEVRKYFLFNLDLFL